VTASTPAFSASISTGQLGGMQLAPLGWAVPRKYETAGVSVKRRRARVPELFITLRPRRHFGSFTVCLCMRATVRYIVMQYPRIAKVSRLTPRLPEYVVQTRSCSKGGTPWPRTFEYSAERAPNLTLHATFVNHELILVHRLLSC
jgi:hypothetical protein